MLLVRLPDAGTNLQFHQRCWDFGILLLTLTEIKVLHLSQDGTLHRRSWRSTSAARRASYVTGTFSGTSPAGTSTGSRCDEVTP